MPSMDGATTSPPADPVAAQQELSAIAASVIPDLLIIGRGPSEADSFDVTLAPSTVKLATALSEVVQDRVANWSQCELVPYGPATAVNDNQLMWVAATEVTMLDIPGVDATVADLPPFDPSPAALRRLKLSALRANTTSGRAIFYRALTPSQVIGRNKKIPLVRRGNRFDTLSGDAVLLDREVDAVSVGGVVFFSNRARFQRVFGFLEELQHRAGQTFDTVTAGLNIKGMSELRTSATSQWQMLGKMASIESKLQKYPAYKNAITMPNLVAFVLANPHTGVKVEGEGAAAQLVFEPDVQHRFKILKLLDDDYLRSTLTQLAYEANSKGLPLD